MKLRQLIAQLDFFAKPIPLNIGGVEKFKTRTGAAVSILFGLSCLAVALQGFIGYLDTTNPSTFLESYSTEHYPQIDLFKEKLIPFFVGSATDVDFLPVEKLSYYVYK